MNSPIVRVTGTFCDSLAHPVVRGRPNCQCLIDKNNGQKVQQIVCPTRRFREPNRRVRLSNVGENTVKGKELARLSKIASASSPSAPSEFHSDAVWRPTVRAVPATPVLDSLAMFNL